MKRIIIFLFLALALLPRSSTTLAQTNTAAPANDCAVTWQPVTVPNVGNLRAVEALSPTDIWVGGDNDFLHWNGVNWTPVAKPNGAMVVRISASSATDLWAVAWVERMSATYLFHSDGATWTNVTLPNSQYLQDVYAVAPDDVWVVGLVAPQSFHWDGSTWTSNTLNPDMYGSLYGVTVAGGHVYAAGAVGEHLVSAALFKWNGTSLDSSLTGAIGKFTKLSASADDNVWAIGTEYTSASAVQWNGGAWVRHDMPSAQQDIAALAADNVYVVGDKILHWNGSDWLLNAIPPHPLQGISALSETELWAVGDASTVLHGTSPCAAMGCAQAPVISKPATNAVLHTQHVVLRWNKQGCATSYKYVIQKDIIDGPRVAKGRVTKTNVTTPTLIWRHTYYWRVRACNEVSCGAWSGWSQFRIKP